MRVSGSLVDLAQVLVGLRDQAERVRLQAELLGEPGVVDLEVVGAEPGEDEAQLLLAEEDSVLVDGGLEGPPGYAASAPAVLQAEGSEDVLPLVGQLLLDLLALAADDAPAQPAHH